MARSRNGEAISPGRRTRGERRRLATLLIKSKKRGDLKTWRRCMAVKGYLSGSRVIELATQLGATRGSVNRWLQWFEAEGTAGLFPRERLGPAPRLTGKQQEELVAVVTAGPQAAGYSSGVWTGPMIGQWIKKRYGVKYHNHYIPYLLHQLGFSVQRPRKRLARADAEKQGVWLRETLPRIKKKRPRVGA